MIAAESKFVAAFQPIFTRMPEAPAPNFLYYRQRPGRAATRFGSIAKAEQKRARAAATCCVASVGGNAFEHVARLKVL